MRSGFEQKRERRFKLFPINAEDEQWTTLPCLCTIIKKTDAQARPFQYRRNCFVFKLVQHLNRFQNEASMQCIQKHALWFVRFFFVAVQYTLHDNSQIRSVQHEQSSKIGHFDNMIHILSLLLLECFTGLDREDIVVIFSLLTDSMTIHFMQARSYGCEVYGAITKA